MLFKAYLKNASELKAFQSSVSDVLAIIEDPEGGSEVHFEAECVEHLPKSFRGICEPVSREIDWERQWEEFSPHYKRGLFSLDLSSYGAEKTLLLKPGPGFGDLSHPTTSLMLKLMKLHLAGLKSGAVLDVGSGSGILALAASLLGSGDVAGIDIDTEANRHARKNACLNGLTHVRFSLPHRLKLSGEPPKTILLNMLLDEQRQAIASLPFDIRQTKIFLSSGILKEQKKEYIQFLSTLGFSPIKFLEETGWLGICATNSGQSQAVC